MSSDRFLPTKQVSELVGLNPRQIRDYVSRGQFPPPIPLSRRHNVWCEAEVREWMAEQMKEAPQRRADLADSMSDLSRGARSDEPPF